MMTWRSTPPLSERARPGSHRQAAGGRGMGGHTLGADQSEGLGAPLQLRDAHLRGRGEDRVAL